MRLNKRLAGTPELAALGGALAAVALYASLPWFLAAAVAAGLALRLAGRSARRAAAPAPLAAGAIFSLVLYALLAAIVVLSVRAALGLLDRPVLPFDQTPLPAYMQQAALGYYDKSELRLALLELLCFTAALAWLFLESARYLALRRGRPPRPHPASAAFALVLYFAAVALPPYAVNAEHWLPFVASATGIRHGVWPYLDGFDSSYGLLAPAFLALWLSWFGLSELSLSALIMASNLVCGAAGFALMRRLSGSRAVALLGSAILLLQATHATAVTSAFRAPLQITLGALLLYRSLSGRGSRAAAGFLFGVIALWSPPFGAFALAGFVLAHGYAAYCAGAAQRREHLAAMRAMLAGVVLPLAAIWAANAGTAAGPEELYAGATAGSKLALLGFGNSAQQIDPIVFPALMMLVLYLSATFHRLQRGRRISARGLFVGASIVAALPYIVYATGRSDASHYFAAYWALMPGMALLFYGLARLLSLRPQAAPVNPGLPRWSLGRSAGMLAVVYLIAFPYARLTEAVANQALAYEPAREKWYQACAAGKDCDSALKPSLRRYLEQARRRLPGVEPVGRDAGLAAACRQGIPVVSYRDALIYAAADCYTPLGLPTVNQVITRHDLERYTARLQLHRHIVVDHGSNAFAQWRGDMIGEIKSRLQALGYAERAGCGTFSVLSKEDPAALLRRLCG
jgi:hypothetical protein